MHGVQDGNMFELTLYIAAFVILSGAMAAVESAVLSVSRGEVEEMVINRRWGALSLRDVTLGISRSMVVIVVLTNTINILGPILVGRRAIQVYGDIAIVALTIILTLSTIVFSEIIPKSVGNHYAPSISRIVAPSIQALVLLLFPIVVALEWLSELFKIGNRRIGTELQIRSLAKIGRQAGYIESNEGHLIHRAFILNDRMARDIMTPLDRMVAIKDESSIEEAAVHVTRHAFSRYPVVGASQHDLKGLVMSREILQAMTEGKATESIAGLCRPCLVVPADMKSDELLVEFRDKHVHLGVVQDQQQTIGLVTLEDVLEELVGEIEDEKDVEPSKRKQCPQACLPEDRKGTLRK